MEKTGVTLMRKIGPSAARPGSTPSPPDQSRSVDFVGVPIFFIVRVLAPLLELEEVILVAMAKLCLLLYEPLYTTTQEETIPRGCPFFRTTLWLYERVRVSKNALEFGAMLR
jgi:hypothetical protein